jgi:cell wall assembly regulator SMI1
VTRPPPARATAIAEAEQRLGVTRPQSYRAFLEAANGLKEYSPIGVELWTVEKISWVLDAGRTLLDFHEMTGLEDLVKGVRKSLLIGSEPDGAECLLLVPADDPAAE